MADNDLEKGFIERLEEIEADGTLKLARGIWQSRGAECRERIASHGSQVHNLTNEIYQLLGFVSAFQGLLLTAVAQASQLKCHNVGIPLALSLFATFVTLAGVLQKKGLITKLELTLSIEKPLRRAFNVKLQLLEDRGRRFNFKDLQNALREDRTTDACTCSPKWVTYNNGVVVCVLLLGGICALFIYRVLCDP